MIFDLHNDVITSKRVSTVKKLVNNNKVALAVWGTYLSSDQAQMYAKKASKVSFVAFEDISFTDDITKIIDYNPLYCSLTWNYDNCLAGGAMEYGDLTNEGALTIKTLNAFKIPLDTAHLNRKSFFNAVELADRVICSHTCINTVNPHPRNLTDEQIKILIEKNGLIGLTFVSDFLSTESATILDVTKHIEYFADKFGIDNLAIGSDFYGTTPLKNLKKYDDLSNLKNILLERGFNENDIEKIFFINANNYFGDRL